MGTFARSFACRKTALTLVPPEFSLSAELGTPFAMRLVGAFNTHFSAIKIFRCPENFNGQERIRTSEAQVQQISSALKLPRGLDYLITLTFRFRW